MTKLRSKPNALRYTLYALLFCAGFAPLVFATTLTQWTQTTFMLDQGTYANTQPRTNGNEVGLVLGSSSAIYDYIGTGNDGPLNVTSGTQFNPNTQTNGFEGRTQPDAWNSRISGITANTVTLVTTPPTGALAPGDEVLLISLKGAVGAYANVGNYEFFRVFGVTGNVVTFAWNKNKFYGNAAGVDTAVGTTQFVMLQRVPQYTSVTVPIGISGGAATYLLCSPWNGTLGGVLAFRANGTVTVGSDTGKSDTTNRSAYIYAWGYGIRGASGPAYNANAPSGES